MAPRGWIRWRRRQRWDLSGVRERRTAPRARAHLDPSTQLEGGETAAAAQWRLGGSLEQQPVDGSR
uniref:Uncharacterized protein n=1 Tax=Oryza nivara TaxID=4536 RepID=A0A0E0IKN2_ORYNI